MWVWRAREEMRPSVRVNSIPRGAKGEDYVAELGGLFGELQAPGGVGKGEDRHVADGVAGDDKGSEVKPMAIDQANLLGVADDMGVGHGDLAVGPDEGGTQEAVLGVAGADGEDHVHRRVEGRGAGGLDQGDRRQDQKRGQRLDEVERSLPPLPVGLHSGNPCSASMRSC